MKYAMRYENSLLFPHARSHS